MTSTLYGDDYLNDNGYDLVGDADDCCVTYCHSLKNDNMQRNDSAYDMHYILCHKRDMLLVDDLFHSFHSSCAALHSADC